MIQKRAISPHLHLFLLDLEEFLSRNKALKKRELEKSGLTALLTAAFPTNTPALGYTSKGKPYLDKCEKFISVSHSHQFLALLVNDKEETGVDIELIRDKVQRIKHKFLNEEELAFAGDDSATLLRLWAAKEALYKLDGQKELRFKEDLHIAPFTNPDHIEGQILRGDKERKFVLVSEQVEAYILVYVLHEVF